MPDLPSISDLEILPRTAVVAFAAICARRVQPLFALAENVEDHATHVMNINQAIAYAEMYASLPSKSEMALFANGYVYETAQEARKAEFAATDAKDRAAANSASVASDAADAAVSAFDSEMNDDEDLEPPSNISDKPHEECILAVMNAVKVAALSTSVEAINHDFTTILNSLSGKEVNYKSEVAYQVFMPVWPDGEPDWYAEGLKRTREILGQPENIHEVKVADSFGATDAMSSEVHEDEDSPNEKDEGIEEINPKIAIGFDPDLITPEEYAELVEALGDVIRSEGGLGIERLRTAGFEVNVGEGALL